ncbi:uncharacterized protein N7483_007571 [Penicillium malachiteum]|uniref:uncharacterized protein n=1 Tax=Penicillium malachiteum TaxID=1324776 RepID=UPI002546EAAF|nr:uncharacterized protein N7483_007571 [Penicillium malachiteum]KAJ5726214.1 hypothetical protein N7483_007571 [Penicillium malachiteum]
MASPNPSLSDSSDHSPLDRKNKATQNAYPVTTVSVKDKVPLPGIPRSQKTPCGKTHAGEVQRRTNRRVNSPPPPSEGQSSTGSSTNTSSRSSRRTNRSHDNQGNNDSDSEDERKRHRHPDSGDDDDVGGIKRGKRPASPVSYSAESPSLPAMINMEEEERFDRTI